MYNMSVKQIKLWLRDGMDVTMSCKSKYLSKQYADIVVCLACMLTVDFDAQNIIMGVY